MSADNVTPFRPRRPAPKPPAGNPFTSPRGKAALVHALTLAAFALNWFLRAPPLAFIGLAVGVGAGLLAFANRSAAMPWATTHHQFAFRTLMIGYALWVIASLLPTITAFLGMAALLIQLVVALWAGLRALYGLALAAQRKPIERIGAWLF